jgi:hypothetical protein
MLPALMADRRQRNSELHLEHLLEEDEAQQADEKGILEIFGPERLDTDELDRDEPLARDDAGD